MAMWILLMIIFSAPYEIEKVEILNTYHSKKKCVEEINRAIEMEVPRETSFGCVKIERIREVDKSF